MIASNPKNAHAHFRRGFAHKALGRLVEAAADIEAAKLLEPENARLMVNYKDLHDVVVIELCRAGHEPE